MSTVTLSPKKLNGEIRAIASKSEAHRVLICCALCSEPTTLELCDSCDDIDATIGCLNALGAKITRNCTRLDIVPIKKICGTPVLDCKESGSTLRFLLPVAAALYEKVEFQGCGRLPDRPISLLTDEMKRHGVAFSNDRLPFSTYGLLKGGEYTLPGNVSSQYITGLLLALPLTKEKSSIALTTQLESSAYVDITMRTLERFSVSIKRLSSGFTIERSQRYVSSDKVTVGGDWSNAAFFLAAGALGNSVTVNGLDALSAQGDKEILSLLERFGAKIKATDNKVTVTGGVLHCCNIDIAQTPDLLPVLAVVASFADGKTNFTNASRLRLKESDRLSTTAAMLNSLGGCAKAESDSLTVTGKALSGGTVDSFNDHRIAMAAAVAATISKGDVTINSAQAVNKSYPSFFDDYNKLGGGANVIDIR